jgi:hypothetical protein
MSWSFATASGERLNFRTVIAVNGSSRNSGIEIANLVLLLKAVIAARDG